MRAGGVAVGWRRVWIGVERVFGGCCLDRVLLTLVAGMMAVGHTEVQGRQMRVGSLRAEESSKVKVEPCEIVEAGYGPELQ